MADAVAVLGHHSTPAAWRMAAAQAAMSPTKMMTPLHGKKSRKRPKIVWINIESVS